VCGKKYNLYVDAVIALVLYVGALQWLVNQLRIFWFIVQNKSKYCLPLNDWTNRMFRNISRKSSTLTCVKFKESALLNVAPSLRGIFESTPKFTQPFLWAVLHIPYENLLSDGIYTCDLLQPALAGARSKTTCVWGRSRFRIQRWAWMWVLCVVR
jgi:hypothetical protein